MVIWQDVGAEVERHGPITPRIASAISTADGVKIILKPRDRLDACLIGTARRALKGLLAIRAEACWENHFL
jgi:hypothetical protein